VSKKRTEWSLWGLVRLEGDMSYGFPAIVAIGSVFLFVTFYTVFRLVSTHMDVYIQPGPGWDGASKAEELSKLAAEAGIRILAKSILTCISVFFLLIPILVAYSFAQGIAIGQMRTLLSYPLDRKTVFLVKLGIVILVAAAPASLIPLTAALFYAPAIVQLDLVLMAVVSLWVLAFHMASVSTFIAIATRSARVTAFAGFAIYYAAFVPMGVPDFPTIVKGILFPPMITMEYLGYGFQWAFNEEITISMALGSMGIGLLLGVVLMTLSLVLFRRTEL
jgi:ABC-type transport system involved in multi-copper enzyme maturation permease subunit